MESYERAKQLLQDNIETLNNLANAILEHESLDGDQIDRIIKGEKLKPPVHNTEKPNNAETNGVPDEIKDENTSANNDGNLVTEPLKS
jgi:cell division protease FtsH